MRRLTELQKKALEWAFAEPCADVILLKLRSAYAAGHAMVIYMTLDGREWIKRHLPDPEPGCAPRVERHKIDMLVALMEGAGLKVEIRG
jgi:hypothetical protein